MQYVKPSGLPISSPWMPSSQVKIELSAENMLASEACAAPDNDGLLSYFSLLVWQAL